MSGSDGLKSVHVRDPAARPLPNIGHLYPFIMSVAENRDYKYVLLGALAVTWEIGIYGI